MKESFLSRFTPSLLSRDALEAMFVKRESLAQSIVDGIQESATTGNKHYVLVVGPRGIGKTHLVSLIYHRIAGNPLLSDRLLIAWLREEEWGVASYLDFLLVILRSLVDGGVDSGLKERLADIVASGDAGAAEPLCEKLLLEVIGDKTLLIVVENLDQIFEGLGSDGQHKLRAYIQNHPRFAILATAQSLFKAVTKRDEPFHGFFNTHHIGEFTLEDAIQMVARIASLEDDHELAAELDKPAGRARMRAVHHLAGGNPRIYVIFSQFLNCRSLNDLVEPLLKTLDELTPYYQSRMSYLSPQQRKIVEYLCDHAGASPVKQIAADNFISQQSASGQLGKLTELGYTRSFNRGRESYYELREALLRLTLEVKKQRGEPLRLIIEFLQVWYSSYEIKKRLADLSDDSPYEREYLSAALQHMPAGEKVRALVYRGVTKGQSGDIQGAINDYSAVIDMDGAPIEMKAIVLNNIGVIRFEEGALEKALNLFDESIEHHVDHVSSCANKGEVLYCLNRMDSALATIEHALELQGEGRTFGLHSHRGAILLAQGKKREGVESLREAVKILKTCEDDADSGRIAIVRNLLIRTRNRSEWRQVIPVYLEVFREDDLVATLGQGLVESIRTLRITWLNDDDRRAWAQTWREFAEPYDSMRIPLHMLDAAVAYLAEHDDRALLGIASEERRILELLLGIRIG